MILQKKTINNVPTLVPLTADTGSGVPVGTIIGQYKKVNMAGYLYLDGSTFDQTLYPALYAYLGTNVLPDYREFVLVGAEQNTNSTVINQTGHSHDVFTQGEEKDDQLQDHVQSVGDTSNLLSGELVESTGAGSSMLKLIFGAQSNAITASDIVEGRHGTTTRTKEKAVFWYIKATTGIIESEATDVLNVINDKLATKELTNITVNNGYGKAWRSGNTVTIAWSTRNDTSVSIPAAASTLISGLPAPKVEDLAYWNGGNPYAPMYNPGGNGVIVPDVTANVTKDGYLVVYNGTGAPISGVYKGFYITYLTDDN